MDAVPAQALDPGPLLARDLARLELLVRVLAVGDDCGGVDPLLGEPLHLVVERGDHLVAAGIDLLALGLAAQELAELLAHLPHEVRCAPRIRTLVGEDDGLGLGRLEVRVRVRPARQVRARLHELEDLVAAAHHLGVLRDDQARLDLAVLVRVLLLDGVLDEIVGGGRLRNAGEERVLGEREVLEVLLPVALGGGGDAIAPVAVEVVVEVRLHDRLLARGSRVRLGQANRLDDLARLALVHAVRERTLGQEPSSHELLGDRGTTAVVALDRVDGRGRERDGIEARVLPERLVLDRRRGVHENRRDLVEGHASRRSEPRRASRTLPVRSHTAVCWSKSMASSALLGSGRSFERNE